MHPQNGCACNCCSRATPPHTSAPGFQIYAEATRFAGLVAAKCAELAFEFRVNYLVARCLVKRYEVDASDAWRSIVDVAISNTPSRKACIALVGTTACAYLAGRMIRNNSTSIIDAAVSMVCETRSDEDLQLICHAQGDGQSIVRFGNPVPYAAAASPPWWASFPVLRRLYVQREEPLPGRNLIAGHVERRAAYVGIVPRFLHFLERAAMKRVAARELVIRRNKHSSNVAVSVVGTTGIGIHTVLLREYRARGLQNEYLRFSHRLIGIETGTMLADEFYTLATRVILTTSNPAFEPAAIQRLQLASLEIAHMTHLFPAAAPGRVPSFRQ